MDGILWTDLDSAEQRAIAMLGDGVAVEFCDPVAVLTLMRIGLVKSSRLTPEAERLLPAALLHEFA
jgi:hypothetical protein